MAELKRNFLKAKMNKDSDERVIPPGEYRDALNVQIQTSSTGDVGSLQNIKGNTKITNVVGGGTYPTPHADDICVGIVSHPSTDKIYYFINSGGGDVKKDYILQYDPILNLIAYVFVDIYSVKKTGLSGTTATFTVDAAEAKTIRPGMIFEAGNTTYKVTKVDPSGTPTVTLDAAAPLPNPLVLTHRKTLNFPEKLITGINILDDNLFWTDNATEPKRINITRSIRGTGGASAVPATLPSGDNANYHTRFIRVTPGTSSDLEIITYENGGTFPRFMALKDITVIRKPPLQALKVSAFNTAESRTDPISGIVNATIIWSGLYPVGSTITGLNFTFPVDFRAGDIVSFTALSGTTTASGSYDVKLEVLPTTSSGEGAFDSGYEFKVLTISAGLISTVNDWTVDLIARETFLDDKFVRFCHRYKYQDGEYSTFAPWSEVAFIPGAYNYAAQEGYNEGMVNGVRSLTLENYVPVNIPYGVTDIDLLYKETNNPTVYTVETVKPTVTSYEMQTDMVHAVVPSNQLLRPWDNVPRVALAQEVSANRIIYGNYLQNYNVNKEPSAFVGTISSSINPLTGVGGEPSVKSLRQYQVGVVFSDEHGRETPVLTSTNQSTHVGVDLAWRSNKLRVGLDIQGPPPPTWAKYYSFYVKEPTVEYYTLAMDRWYNAADGNIWISFPSSERNKLDEETFLYLKKAHGNSIPVLTSTEYKILAIENEAPDFIKTLYRHIGNVENTGSNANDSIGTDEGGYPLIGTRVVSIFDTASGSLGQELDGDSMLTSYWRLRFSDTDDVTGTLSRFYDVDKVTKSDGKIFFHLHGSISNDLSFATTPGEENTYENRIDTLRLQVFKGAIKSRPEFDGRFFVKISKDLDVTNYITSFEGDDFLVYDTQELAYINNNCYVDGTFSEPKSFESSNVWFTTPNENHPTEVAAAYGGSQYSWADASGVLGTSLTSSANTGGAALNDGSPDSVKFWGARAARFFIDRASAYSWSGRANHLPGNIYDGVYANGRWYDSGYYGLLSAENSLNAFDSTNLNGNWWISEWAISTSKTIAWMTNAKDDGDFVDSAGTKGMAKPGRGLFNSEGYGYMDISWSGFSGAENWIATGGGSTAPWPPGEAPELEANQVTRIAFDPSFNGTGNSPGDFIEKLYRPGAKFRFKLDPDSTSYTVHPNWDVITGDSENYWNFNEIYNDGSGADGAGYLTSMYRHGHYGIRNYKTSDSDGQWDEDNLRQKWSIKVTPPFGSGPSGYTPTTGTQNEGAGVTTTRAVHHDGTGPYDAIEILVPTTIDDDGNDISGGFVSNPAVWETKPKESVDIDIYYQASDIIPLDITPETNEDLIPTNSTFTLGATTHKVISWDKLKINTDSDITTATFNAASNTYVEITTPSGRKTTLQLSGVNGNSYVTVEGTSGLPYISHVLSWNNCWSFGNGVESDRVRDDYNAPQMDNGVKASTVLAEQVKEERRKHGLIWSGIYNSTSGVNETNQFIAGEKITKDLNPVYGSLQALLNRDTRLVMFCEDRVLKGVTNKDALYNADGNPQLISSNATVGDVTPYVGNYGISKNPESLAVSPSTAYFTDVNRGRVLALSGEGIRPISDIGMEGHFSTLKQVSGTVLGTFDTMAKEYNLTSKLFNTASFSERSNSWVSFKSFQPRAGVSLNNDYYTFANGDLWVHHTNSLYNNFYGSQYKSSVTTIFGDTSGKVKSFNAVNYEGSQARVTAFTDIDDVNLLNGVWATNDGITETDNVTDGEYFNLVAKKGWYLSSMKTDLQTASETEFKDKEGKWFGVPSGDNTVSSTANFSTQGLGTATAAYSGSASGTVTISLANSSTGSDGSDWDQ
jgi:hypothetical protein